MNRSAGQTMTVAAYTVVTQFDFVTFGRFHAISIHRSFRRNKPSQSRFA
jgi:hypothetical protein